MMPDSGTVFTITLRTYVPCFEHVAYCWWLSYEATCVDQQIRPSFSVQESNCHLCSFRILVGAPQAAGQGPLRGSRPGALFRCPITPEEYDCERVDIDGEGVWESRNDKFISSWNLRPVIVHYSIYCTKNGMIPYTVAQGLVGVQMGFFNLYIFPLSFFVLPQWVWTERANTTSGWELLSRVRGSEGKWW